MQNVGPISTYRATDILPLLRDALVWDLLYQYDDRHVAKVFDATFRGFVMHMYEVMPMSVQQPCKVYTQSRRTNLGRRRTLIFSSTTFTEQEAAELPDSALMVLKNANGIQVINAVGYTRTTIMAKPRWVPQTRYSIADPFARLCNQCNLGLNDPSNPGQPKCIDWFWTTYDPETCEKIFGNISIY